MQVTHDLAPLLPPGGLWAQDPTLYHATLFHASPHAVRAQQAEADYLTHGNACQMMCGAHAWELNLMCVMCFGSMHKIAVTAHMGLLQ